MKIKITARKVIWASLGILLLLMLRPVTFLIYVYAKDQKALRKEKTDIIQDASNLNQITVDTIVKVLKDPNEAIQQIRNLIKKADEQGKSISIAGAQHTMGGHTIYKHGIVLDMKPFNYMKVDTAKNILMVGAGALWSEVIPYLEQYDKSVKVMQSNNSFSVGGSISVNCHGWQANSPPIASTVESFRLINPSGEILNCSRSENSELFSLALGGYGLFGVILDLQLKITDNKTYISKQYVIKSKDYFSEFKKLLKGGGGFDMAYGRINVNHDHFMEEAILSTYVLKTDMTKKSSGKNTYSTFRRTLFRASVNSDYGKNLRWAIEKMAVNVVNDREFTRNKLLGEGVEVFQNTDPDYTDILHEYFVPGDSLTHFIIAIQKIMPQYKVDLLNITVRNVMTDNDTYLSYAKGEMFGLVMLFNQRKDKNAEAEMAAFTQKLIGTVIHFKGTYYLPYRLHATKNLMYRAYPNASTFFKLKTKYDPQLVFRNQFYEKYKP